MNEHRERPEAQTTVVQVTGRIGEDLADYARRKVDALLTRTRRPVLRSRVRVVRHDDPARERPIAAHASVDLDGTLLHVHIDAETPREAIDRLVDRLAHRLDRAAEHWEARRGRNYHAKPPVAG